LIVEQVKCAVAMLCAQLDQSGIRPCTADPKANIAQCHEHLLAWMGAETRYPGKSHRFEGTVPPDFIGEWFPPT
jgi:hypothetical protein